MRTIITQIFRNFTFELSEDEKAYAADGEAGQSVARGLKCAAPSSPLPPPPRPCSPLS